MFNAFGPGLIYNRGPINLSSHSWFQWKQDISPGAILFPPRHDGKASSH